MEKFRKSKKKLNGITVTTCQKSLRLSGGPFFSYHTGNRVSGISTAREMFQKTSLLRVGFGNPLNTAPEILTANSAKVDIFR